MGDCAVGVYHTNGRVSVCVGVLLCFKASRLAPSIMCSLCVVISTFS